ncbi:T9SS type A sorting domain-containing protein [bacterium]|nr:T9SS type A sorting domain-containing protein [bacterium]
MKTALTITLLFIVAAFSGTISGELVYPAGGLGAYAVVIISQDDIATFIAGADTIDPATFFMSLPRAIIFSPGPFSIDGDFVDDMPYTIFGLKPSGMSIQSGDPMGLSSVDIFTRDGSAEGITVELATEGNIGGYINYFGSFPGCKINVYDAMQNPPVIEGTYTVESVDYDITVPSGFKTLEFYIDSNGNNEWDPDELESGVYYTNPVSGSWGPIVFVGGGHRFDYGVDVTLLPSEVCETKRNNSPRIEYSSFGRIKFSNCYGNVSIADILGKIILERNISDNDEIQLNPNLPTGMYFVIFDGANQKSVRKINLIH